ncbi:MAG TPA: cysteine desulfurase NifS, partial [Lentisphaeria bacterium]|nr:cysteine desulfurase NifS [Lentisphaeria bacterium]
MIYLDHAAAARPPREILDFYRACLEESYANQEAAHRLGYDARRRLDAAAEQLSTALAG